MMEDARFEHRTMAERVLELTGAFMESIAANPAMAPMIPAGATLILMPDNDPELAAHNVSLGIGAIAAGENVYFLHIQMTGAHADMSVQQRA